MKPETHPDSYFTQRESWRDWRIEARELIRLVRLTRGARVLEIGCGGGGLLRLLRERGARAVGVDTLPSALRLARERVDLSTGKENSAALSSGHPVTWSRIGEDNRLPFPANTFDAVIAQHVVEHIPDVDAALREWARVLKPGGRLALATPNACYPDPTHFADADHARVFSPRALSAAVTRAGFSLESCRTIFPFLSRLRPLRALGVMAYALFVRAPYFASRGRTILLCAQMGCQRAQRV